MKKVKKIIGTLLIICSGCIVLIFLGIVFFIIKDFLGWKITAFILAVCSAIPLASLGQYLLDE